MAAEDVVHVLRRFREALVPAGVMLDLQVIRPDPVVEVGGAPVCEIDGSLLVEEAVDDHDVLKHYSSGAELVEDLASKPRKLPPEAVPVLERLERPCVVRERCRLRRLRRSD